MAIILNVLEINSQLYFSVHATNNMLHGCIISTWSYCSKQFIDFDTTKVLAHFMGI